MARDEPAPGPIHPMALDNPEVSLIGNVDETMVEKLRQALATADTDGDLAIELTTPGGAADYARRMALDVRQAADRRRGRLLFLGKTQLYSAGVMIMAAFPREHRYVSADTRLLIHCRQLERTLHLDGPLRSSLPVIDAVRNEIEHGLELERLTFEELIAGSDISLDELFERASRNWYLTAAEAQQRKLIAGIV